jgi:hypothetical protein
MPDQMAALAMRTRPVVGLNASKSRLLDGLDDNWQACGAGVRGSFHDANGRPLVNRSRMFVGCFYSYGCNRSTTTPFIHIIHSKTAVKAT